jgi:ribosomal-protein-alanine N-acetyltransferase
VNRQASGWQPGALLRLETPRFIVRSMTREDVTDTFIGWLADPEVMLGLNLPRRRLSRSQAVRWVLGFDNRVRFCLGLHVRRDGPQIGFFTVDCDLKNRCGETSVVIGDRSFWGRNVVIETRSSLLDFLFEEMDLHKVTGKPHGRNFASIYNYKALGFTCEAVLREQLCSIQDGTRLDQLIFGMLRSAWRARRGDLEG